MLHCVPSEHRSLQLLRLPLSSALNYLLLLTPPLLKAHCSSTIDLPFLTGLFPSSCLSLSLILPSHTAGMLLSPSGSKSSWVSARMSVCHTQKPANCDHLYRKRHARSNQAGSKMQHRALLECSHLSLKSHFCQKNPDPTLQIAGLNLTKCYLVAHKIKKHSCKMLQIYL